MESKNKFILFGVCVLIIFILFAILNMPLDKKVIPARFTLGENSGFDLSSGELTFGMIEVNQSATRDTTVSNSFNEPIIVTVESSGEISKSLIVSENNFRLDVLESKNITFSINTIGLTEFREYSGNVTIISRRI